MASPDGAARLPLPLADGALAAADALELQELKRQIRSAVGFACEAYKESCLRRRLAVRMRARGVHRYGDYGALLEQDPEEYQHFLAAVTINVSKFFRNPEVWGAIREHVVPALFALHVPYVRIWSAGGAAGEEAYSVAILLREHAAAHGLEERLARFRIRSTDLDEISLARGLRGEYGELALSETPDATRERWFEGSRPWRLRPEVRRMVQFEHADLLQEPFPGSQHLVLCRNVIIYFERMLQERLFSAFHESLSPGGFLVLGKVETLFGPVARRYRTVANTERVFQAS